MRVSAPSRHPSSGPADHGHVLGTAITCEVWQSMLSVALMPRCTMKRQSRWPLSGCCRNTAHAAAVVELPTLRLGSALHESLAQSTTSQCELPPCSLVASADTRCAPQSRGPDRKLSL